MKPCNYSGPCKVCGNNKPLWFVNKANDELCAKCATTIVATGKPPASAVKPEIDNPAPIAEKGPVRALTVAKPDAPSFDINEARTMDICYNSIANQRFAFIEWIDS